MASEAAVVTRRSSTLSMREIFLLSDRLEARSKNALHRDQPLLCEDMRLAALSLRAMGRSIHVSDVLTVEE
jgi:hypothetical protein